jgi:hypothetical protein
MNTSSLCSALQTHPMTRDTFIGVFPRDLAPPPDRHGLGSMIINTHDSHLPGQHWIAVFITKTHVHYHDSYGLPPDILNILPILRGSRPVTFDTKRLQGHSDACGYYCLYFILSQLDSRISMSVFSDDFLANDRLVKLRVEREFNVGLPI